MTTDPSSSVDSVSAGYGDAARAARRRASRSDEGEIVAIVGANGAGKTTLLSTVVGLNRVWDGSVRFDGAVLNGVPAHEVPHRGLVMVPEGRRLFPAMTRAREPADGRLRPARQERAGRFPRHRLRAVPGPCRTGGRSSPAPCPGGSSRCARSAGRLMAKPRLLLLDEPSLGLAPIIVEEVLGLVRRLVDTGMTIVLVEQNVHDALEMADRGYVLDQGQVAMTGTGAELLGRSDLQQAYLGA